MAEEPHEILDKLKPFVPSIRPSFKQSVVLATEGKKFNNGMRNLILKSAPDDVKKLIKILKDPACPAHLRPTRILVHGSSGCGKTTLGYAFAQEAGLECIYVPAASLGNEYQNSVIANLERIITGLKGPCVLLLDQVEIILKRVKDSKEDIPTQVINILDKLAQANVIVWATTNKLEDIEKPLQTRFSGDAIKMHNPTSNELRTEIFLTHMDGIQSSLCHQCVNNIVNKTYRFSIRELEGVIRWAHTYSYDRQSKTVDKEDFDKAIKRVEEGRKALANKESWAKWSKRQGEELGHTAAHSATQLATYTVLGAGAKKGYDMLPNSYKQGIGEWSVKFGKLLFSKFSRA